MTERVAFKIFSIINHTEQWLPRRQMEIQTKGMCGEKGGRARTVWREEQGEAKKGVESEQEWKFCVKKKNQNLNLKLII